MHSLCLQNSGPFRAALGEAAESATQETLAAPAGSPAGVPQRAGAAEGVPEGAGVPAGEGTQPRRSPVSKEFGFTFRSVFRIQMKVQTLGLLGHFSTMNPPGPFSPLQGNKDSSTESGWGRLRSCSPWHVGCVAPTLAPAVAPPGLAARRGSPAGWEQMCRVPGKGSGLAAGSRANTTRQVSHRCLGSGGARAAAGLQAEEQPLPPNRASPADAGTAPRGGFRGTAWQKWEPTSRSQGSRALGETELGQDRLSADSLITTAPRSFLAPSERLSEESRAYTHSPDTDFPSLLRNTRYFCCVHSLKRFF